MTAFALIDSLNEDHRNIARVLKCIETALDELDTDGDTSLETLRLALEYITQFPEDVHHPKRTCSSSASRV